MPFVNPEQYGHHSRSDRQPGHEVVTATTQRYVEEDGSDVRVNRVRVYDQHGNLVRVYLRDTMGVPFADEPHLADDDGYVAALMLVSQAPQVISNL